MSKAQKLYQSKLELEAAIATLNAEIESTWKWVESVNASNDAIEQMREWLADCDFQDANDLAETEIVKAVDKHYAGGATAFLAAL